MSGMSENGIEIDEQPRALRYGDVPADPRSLLLRQLRESERQRAELLAAVACEHFELCQALRSAGTAAADPSSERTQRAWRAVGIVGQRIGELLSGWGVAVKDPTGQPWNSRMTEEYELTAVVQREDVPAPVVAQVDAPLVLRHGKMIRKGKVSVQAPLPPDANSAQRNTRDGEQQEQEEEH